MPAPSVKGYMPLCVTPRSRVCDEQGIGQWPMWKRFDSIKGIVDKYIDEPYRNFLALPYHDIDKLKAEELFYWYTPRCDTAYTLMSRSGDDYSYYKQLLDETIAHYQSVVKKLKHEGKTEDAIFLELSLKYAGDSEDNIYCGDGRVVATVWGMRPRQEQKVLESKISTELVPEVETHTVRYNLGTLGTTNSPTTLKKSHGSKIFANQVPKITVKDGYQFTGWDHSPVGTEVTENLTFSAEYREIPKEQDPPADSRQEKQPEEKPATGQQADIKSTPKHHVRFLSPDNLIIKEVDVEHGKRIMPGDVPQLPAVDNVLCPSWDSDPLNEVIDADCDFKAIRPKTPEKPMHTVRFLTPDNQVMSQAQVEHGTALSPALIPPLPVTNGKICPAWDANPAGEIINSDRDFTAKQPQAVVEVSNGEKMHAVRFLNTDGSEIMHTQVAHGNRLQPDQIPLLPEVGDEEMVKWSPNPMKQVIKRDTDFRIRKGWTWHWPWAWEQGNSRGFWRWLLYILLFLLLAFVILYIMYLNDPCSL